MLEIYLHRAQSELAKTELCEECRTQLNQGLELCRHSSCQYMKHSSCECEFLSTLNLRCAQAPARIQKFYKEKLSEFFSWLRQFLEKNQLEFPCAENLFFSLVICSVAAKIGETNESLNADKIVEILVTELKTKAPKTKQLLLEENKKCCENNEDSNKTECCSCICCKHC